MMRIVLILCLLLCTSAFGATVSVMDSIPYTNFSRWYDTYINRNAATTGYLSATEIIIALQTDGSTNVTHNSYGMIIPGGIRAGYLIDTGMTLDSMRIYLYCTRRSANIPSFTVAGRLMKMLDTMGEAPEPTWNMYDNEVSGAWTTAGAVSTGGSCTEFSTADMTDASNPASCGNETFSSVGPTEGAWTSVKLTTSAQRWYDGSSKELGIKLQGALAECSGCYDTIKFASAQNATTANRPFVKAWYHYTYNEEQGVGAYNTWDSGASSNAVTSWVNEGNAYSANLIYATHASADSTERLIGYNFGFSLPAGSTVAAVEVRALGRGSSATASRRGINLGTTKNNSTQFSLSSGITLTASASPAWTAVYRVTGFNKAEVEASGFGVMVKRTAPQTTSTVYIDQLQARVDYTVPSTGTGRRRRATTGWHSSQN